MAAGQGAVLGTASADPNQGFEGLAFRPDAVRSREAASSTWPTSGRPRWWSRSRSTPSRAAGTLGADVVKGRWEMSGYEDLTAITYVAELDRLLVLSDAQDVLIVLRTDGSVERDVPVPGKQQEGVAVDAEGNVWIADDKDKSVLKLEGGLDTLARRESRRSRRSPAGAARARPSPG